MAADTGSCTIFFYGSKERLKELNQFMKTAWENHCNSESYKPNIFDEYSWLADYDEKWNVIHSENGVIGTGYLEIPVFLRKLKQKFPEIAIKGWVDHDWLICEGEEHMKILSLSDSPEIHFKEGGPDEIYSEDWKSEEEEEKAWEEAQERWCEVEAQWKEELFPEDDLLQVDWYHLQYMLKQQMVVGTKYEGRPANISKLTDGEKVFLVREPENIYDANAIEVRSNIGSLGYISAEVSAKLSPLIDANIIECEGTVITTASKLEYVENVFGTKVLEKDREKLKKEPVLWVNIQIHKC